MFPHVAWFEFRYQLKSPVFWVGCLIFFLLTYGSITVDQVQIGSLGNVHKNSPYAIVQTLAIMCVFAVFIIVAVVANVVIRDDDTGFAPIVRTTRVSKADYLVGRFVGATAAAFSCWRECRSASSSAPGCPGSTPKNLGRTTLSITRTRCSHSACRRF